MKKQLTRSEIGAIVANSKRTRKLEVSKICDGTEHETTYTSISVTTSLDDLDRLSRRFGIPLDGTRPQKYSLHHSSWDTSLAPHFSVSVHVWEE